MLRAHKVEERQLEDSIRNKCVIHRENVSKVDRIQGVDVTEREEPVRRRFLNVVNHALEVNLGRLVFVGESQPGLSKFRSAA